MTDLANQVVLITGAKGGLGTNITETFLAAGASVFGSARNIKDSDFPNPHFAALAGDLSDGKAARDLAANAIRRFQRIDALVHVVGGFAGGQPIAETDDATWDTMLSVNLKPAIQILRAVIPHMRQAGRGRIIAIGSRQAIEPAANLSAYNASKAALVSLIRTAALENRDVGITANADSSFDYKYRGQPQGQPRRRPVEVGPTRARSRACSIPGFRGRRADHGRGHSRLRPGALAMSDEG